MSDCKVLQYFLHKEKEWVQSTPVFPTQEKGVNAKYSSISYTRKMSDCKVLQYFLHKEKEWVQSTPVFPT
jgi:hypothetical protein